jgi:TfoX/Sxy family transcriptional regulator of competence genes
MPYNEALAQKVRDALAGTKGLTEKKMFGGIAFLVGGVMCVGVDKDDLIIRCEKDQTGTLLAKRGVRPFDLSGKRPMQGWLLVGPEATRTAAGFKSWIDFALQWTKRDAKAPAQRAAKRRSSSKK